LVKKINVVNLHITARVVELLDPRFPPGIVTSLLEAQAMKRLLILTAVAMMTAASLGCWHNNHVNRGAPCNTCPTGGVPACGDAYGVPGGMAPQMYSPGPG
jgi:hypothetical protein